MLFVSRASRLRVTYLPKREKYAPNGNIIETRPRVFAEFRHGPVPDWAMKQVLERLDWRWLPEGWTPQMQVSSFDSVAAQQENGWNDEEREGLEKHLLSRPSEDFILVEPQRAPRPWATYDKLFARKGMTQEQAIEKIVEIVVETGVSPQVVIDYELENRERRDVLEAMESLLRVQPAEDEIVVGA